jgi:hypothetical protein
VSRHEAWCQQKALGHSDAAKRMCDTYNLHRMAGGFEVVGKWFAAALADGRTDDTLYDSKSEAVRFQHHNEQWYTFVKIQPCSMNECEAEVLLKTARNLYDKGMRLADPDHAHGGMDVIQRTSVEDQLAQSVGRNTNLVMPWEA